MQNLKHILKYALLLTAILALLEWLTYSARGQAVWGNAVLNTYSVAAAATYYVDFGSGANTNDGSLANPFKHCPGDDAATDTADATVLYLRQGESGRRTDRQQSKLRNYEYETNVMRVIDGYAFLGF